MLSAGLKYPAPFPETMPVSSAAITLSCHGAPVPTSWKPVCELSTFLSSNFSTSISTKSARVITSPEISSTRAGSSAKTEMLSRSTFCPTIPHAYSSTAILSAGDQPIRAILPFHSLQPDMSRIISCMPSALGHLTVYIILLLSIGFSVVQKAILKVSLLVLF